jgi:hypothetical protein
MSVCHAVWVVRVVVGVRDSKAVFDPSPRHIAQTGCIKAVDATLVDPSIGYQVIRDPLELSVVFS